MENTETRLQKLARFIVHINKNYRDYYGKSVADIAHSGNSYLDPDMVEIARSLNSVISKNHDIISFNQIYSVLSYLDSTDLIKIISGEKPMYVQSFKRLLEEYLVVPMYDMDLIISRLKNLVLGRLSNDLSMATRTDFNSKGKGFRVVDNDDVFFKVLKQGRFENHPLRKQLEALTEETVKPGVNIPVFADEKCPDVVSGITFRVYTVDKEPRVDIFSIDDGTLTSLIENRNVDNCEYYILYPIFSKKKSKVLDENDDKEVINNITGLVGFRMMINRSHADTVRSLRDTNSVYYPLYDIINLKGNATIVKISTAPNQSIVETPVTSLENTKETKMKVATFELNDTFKMLEYLKNEDGTWKDHPVSKRIQDLSGEFPRPIPVIRNLISKDDIGDILVITNNEPEGYVSDIICHDDAYWVTVSAYPGTKLEELVEKYQNGETDLLKFYPNYIADADVPDVVDGESVNIIRSLHCFDYREIEPAKVLKFNKLRKLK